MNTFTIFNRRPGGRRAANSPEALKWKAKCYAHRLLDRHRAGHDIGPEWVAWALKQTGDA